MQVLQGLSKNSDKLESLKRSILRSPGEKNGSFLPFLL